MSEPESSRLKVPPWSEEAEQSVIGAVLLDGAVWSDVAWLEASAFYRVEHRFIWLAFDKLTEQKVTIDIVTLGSLLRDTMPGRVDPAYLAEIADSTLASSNATKYADIVFERSTKREIILAAGRLAAAQFPGQDEADKDTTEAFDKLNLLSKGRHGGRSKFPRASSLELRGVDWLWDRWLPGGQLTMLSATGGAGKGTFWCYLLSCMTARRPWPNGKVTPPVEVAVYSPEDDPNVELAPRLEAAGVDRDMVLLMDEPRDAWRLPKEICMAVIDPISHGFTGDGINREDVQRHLNPYALLANESGMSIVGSHHVGKYASTRSGGAARDLPHGSTAWVDTSRWLLMLSRDRKDTDQASRILIRAKGNLGGVDFSWGAYRVIAETRGLGTDSKGRPIENKQVVGMEYIEGNADELFFDALEAPKAEPNNVNEAVLRVLREAPSPMIRKRLAELVMDETNCSDKTVTNALKRLVERQKIANRLATAEEREALGVKSGKVYEIVERPVSEPWQPD